MVKVDRIYVLVNSCLWLQVLFVKGLCYYGVDIWVELHLKLAVGPLAGA